MQVTAAGQETEPEGWAAAYAPRQPANQPDRVAAMLRRYGEGNFTGTRPGHTPGLSSIWKRGAALTPSSADMRCRRCGTPGR